MEGLATVPKKVVAGQLAITKEDVEVIDKAFKPAIDKMLELAPEVVKCFEMEKGDEKTKLSKSLYSDYVKIRTTNAKIHKAEKAKYTAQGKYCDLHKNTRNEIGDPIEAKLKEIRDEAKIQREKDIAELQTLRENEISPYLDDTAPMIPGLGEMSEIIWANLLQGTKSTFELNKKTNEESSLESQKQARYQAETMRRYNLLMPLQKFVAEVNKKGYADFSLNEFDAVLLEAQTLSDKADKEVEDLRSQNATLKEKVETVVAEKEVVVQKNTIFNDQIQKKHEARLPGATDKEKMTAYVLDLRTVMKRYEFTDPKFVEVLVKSNNYITQLVNNIESFNI